MYVPTIQIDLLWSPAAKQWRVRGMIRLVTGGVYEAPLGLTTAESDLDADALDRIISVVTKELESYLF